jgi:hypothetical protein
VTPENIAKFWKSVGIPLVPPDHEIYQTGRGRSRSSAVRDR